MKPYYRPTSTDLAHMRRAIGEKFMRKRKPTLEDIQMRAVFLETFYVDPHVGFTNGIAFPEELEKGCPASWHR